MASVYVLDVTPENWTSCPMDLRTVFEIILTCMRCVALQKESFNQPPTALIACFPDKCEYLLSGELSGSAIQIARNKFNSSLANRTENGLSGEALIGMGISMAVSFVNKQKEKQRGKITVFETSKSFSDFSKQAVEISNCGWAGLDLTAIDVVTLGSLRPAVVLQQLSLKTGGIQISADLANQPGRLLQSLLFTVACPAEGLMKVRQSKIDTLHMGAVCVCHAAPLERGYVCSVCLAVYCGEEASACLICGSRMRRENRDAMALNLQSFNKIQV